MVFIVNLDSWSFSSEFIEYDNFMEALLCFLVFLSFYCLFLQSVWVFYFLFFCFLIALAPVFSVSKMDAIKDCWSNQAVLFTLFSCFLSSSRQSSPKCLLGLQKSHNLVWNSPQRLEFCFFSFLHPDRLLRLNWNDFGVTSPD